MKKNKRNRVEQPTGAQVLAKVGNQERKAIKNIVEEMSDQFLQVLTPYSPDHGIVGGYFSDKASGILKDPSVNLPILKIEKADANDILRFVLDPFFPECLDNFEFQLVSVGIEEQVRKLKVFASLDLGFLLSGREPKGAIDNVVNFFYGRNQESKISKIGFSEIRVLMERFPYVLEALLLAQAYANIVVKAFDLYKKEKEWLEKKCVVENDLLIARLNAIFEDFKIDEKDRVGSLERLGELIPALENLLSIAEVLATEKSRTEEMTIRVDMTKELVNQMATNYRSTLNAQEKLAEEVAIEAKLLSSNATRLAHIKKAVSCLLLHGKAFIAMQLIITFTNVSLQNVSSEILDTIAMKIDATNESTLKAALLVGAKNFKGSMNPLMSLIDRNVDGYKITPPEVPVSEMVG